VKLFVGNLPYSMTSQDLAQLFATVGAVREAAVIADRETNRSRGFGFVTMESSGDGEKALAELQGHLVDGRALKLDKATNQDRDRRPAGGGGSHRDRDRRGGDRGGRGGRRDRYDDGY